MDVLSALAQGQCGDPFSFLGVHPDREGGWVVRAFLPWATSLEISRLRRRRIPMSRTGDDGLWEARIPPSGSSDSDGPPPRYRVAATDPNGREWLIEDPYRFPPTLDESRVAGFLEGRERRAHEFMGAHRWELDGVTGTRFAVWAPHARRVSVVGEFNGWDGRRNPMRRMGASGIWELFIPGVQRGDIYKFEVKTHENHLRLKTDPMALLMELRPSTAAVVWGLEGSWANAMVN